jgi:hypothetical protein
VPLVTSPPLRIRLARHRQGDVLILNLHHAAGDATAALGLLRSITRAYPGRPDPVPQTPPEQVEISAPSRMGNSAHWWVSCVKPPPLRTPCAQRREHRLSYGLRRGVRSFLVHRRRRLNVNKETET